MGELCGATLIHNHGTSTCYRPKGHDDEHEGGCASCEEWDELPTLMWDVDGEDWTQAERAQRDNDQGER